MLDYGVKISDGDADSVRNDPKVIAAYLGVDDEEEVEEVLHEDALLKKAKTGKSDDAKGKKTSREQTTSGEDARCQCTGFQTGSCQEQGTESKGDQTGREIGSHSNSICWQEYCRHCVRPKSRQACCCCRNTTCDGRGITSPSRRQRRQPYPHQGIGPVNETKLNAHGIFHFDQIAAWKAAEVKEAEAYLSFDGRIKREEWVKQAKQLAKGGETEFSKRVETKAKLSQVETGSKNKV